MNCYFCAKDLKTIETRKMKGTSGNILDVCVSCYWFYECPSYCNDCVQTYKNIYQHFGTKKHRENCQSNNPLFLTKDQIILFHQKYMSQSRKRGIRKALANLIIKQILV